MNILNILGPQQLILGPYVSSTAEPIRIRIFLRGIVILKRHISASKWGIIHELLSIILEQLNIDKRARWNDSRATRE